VPNECRPRRFQVGGEALRREADMQFADPDAPRRRDEGRRREPRHLLAVAMSRGQFSKGLAPIGQVVTKGFAVLGNKGVEIDECANSIAHLVGDVARDETAIGMSDQDDVPQFLSTHEIGDIRDMGVEADVAAQKVGALSDPSQRRREHAVSLSSQQVTHA
jgi:hypothetical protein